MTVPADPAAKGLPVPTNRSHHRATRTGLVASLALVLTVLCALVTTGSAAAAADDAPPGKAWVRVGHFVPGMGATQIELTPLEGGATTTLAGNATYGQVTAYETLAPGTWTATVRDTAMDDAEPLLSRSFEISANDARTIAVLGTATAPRLALLTDDLTPPASGSARVRVLSAAESADPVTVTAVNGPTIAQDAVLGQATDYATVPAGSWTLQLRAATASTSVQDVPVASGSVYTVVVLDAGEQSVELDVITDAAGATTAPRGGAKTGGGGTAATAAPSGGALSLLLVPVLLGAVLALVRIRRPRPAPARS